MTRFYFTSLRFNLIMFISLSLSLSPLNKSGDLLISFIRVRLNIISLIKSTFFAEVIYFAIGDNDYLFIPLTCFPRYRLILWMYVLFVCRNLVVTIDLKEESFAPGKKNYEHTRRCLVDNLRQNFNVILAWDPPDEKLCPSSVAAWFHKRGYDVKLCRQKRVERNEYSLKIPVLDSRTDHSKLFEWLGVFSVGGDLDNNRENSYVNSYECPEPLTDVGQVRCIRWTGFVTRKQTEMIFKELTRYIKDRETIPWGSMDVQGFADSPVSWELKEHNFFIDGDNSYTIFVKPNGEFILRTSLSSNNKTKIFQ